MSTLVAWGHFKDDNGLDIHARKQVISINTTNMTRKHTFVALEAHGVAEVKEDIVCISLCLISQLVIGDKSREERPVRIVGVSQSISCS